MPTLVVIWIAKFSAWLTKALGRGEASSLPGLVAERMQPGILEKLGGQLDEVILITGTNGKTTTTRMAAQVLESDDYKLLVNRGGSNLTRGLISSLIADCDIWGRVRSDQAVFEVDEAAFPAAVKALKPKAVVILNLFRDQLDRYGELNTLAAKLKSALKGAKTRAILNADDPLVAWLGIGLSDVSYFGLSSASVQKLEHDHAADSNACPLCGRALTYSQLFYAHIGNYRCSAKDFARPEPNVVANTTLVNLSRSKSTIEVDRRKVDLNLELPGLYNVYNALAAVALGHFLKVDLTQSIERIQSTSAAFGRAESVKVNGRELQIFLVKNPTGFNQVIQAYRSEDQVWPTLILVNDLLADGRDVSWLWDVAFEDMPDSPSVCSGGTRGHDLALRLKYAQTTSDLELSLPAALKKYIESIPEGGRGIILPTYTAMLAVRKELGNYAQMAGMEQ